jgi:hypothetical protein
MADFNKRIFDYITLYDNVNATIIHSNDFSDIVNFYNNTQVFNIYTVNNSDESKFVVHYEMTISDFIKKIPFEYIKFDDITKTTIDYKDKLNDNVEFGIESIAHIHTPRNVYDTAIIRTKVYGNVHYIPDNINNESNFSDSIFAVISKQSVKKFKNAMFTLLGTTEEIIYTCNGKNTTIMNISLCNRILNDINIDVLLYKGGSPIYIMKGILVKPHQSYVINNNEETNIQLEENDEIRVVSDTANSSDIYMALMEQI